MSDLTQAKEQKKNDDKNGKALYKLVINVLYGKTMEKMRNRIDIRVTKKRI